MSIGREDYQERKEARVERYEARAAKAQAESDAASKAAHDILQYMGFFQNAGNPCHVSVSEDFPSRRIWYEKW